MAVVDELFLKLGVQVDQASLGQALGALKNFAGLAAAAFSSFKVVGFLTETAKVGAELDDMSQRFGVSTDEIQKFQYALDQSGVDAESAGASFKLLQKNLEAASSGSGGAADALRAIGVSAKDVSGDDFTGSLNAIADGFQKTGAGAKATTAAMALFGRAGADIIPLLTQGSAGIKELYGEAESLGIILGQDFIQNSAKVDDELAKSRLVWRSLKTTIAVDALPMFQKVVALFSKAARSIRDFVKETNISRYIVPAAFAAAAVSVGIFAVQAAKMVGIVKEGMGLFRSMGAMLSAAWPVAAIVAVALALEDVYVWLTGGDSVIGGLLDKWFGFEKAQQITTDVKVALIGLWEATKGFAATLWNELGPSLTELFHGLVDLGKGIYDYLQVPFSVALVGAKLFFQFTLFQVNVLVKAFQVVASLVTGLFQGVGGLGSAMNAVAHGDFAKVPGILAEAGGKIKGTYEGLSDKLFKPDTPSAPNVPEASAYAQGPSMDGPGGNLRADALNQTNNITIHGASDPKATAAAVRGAVDSSNRVALAKFGVAQ